MQPELEASSGINHHWYGIVFLQGSQDGPSGRRTDQLVAGWITLPGGGGRVLVLLFTVLCFWTLWTCSFGLLWWPHWASTLPKVPPKRHNYEVQKLPSLITVNCTPAYTGTPFSLFSEVIKLPVFEHFSRTMLWRLNLNPFGLTNTGI